MLTRQTEWLLSLSWLAGPIFEKELRVWSRRRRLYVLRFLYICLFGVVVAYTWLAMAPFGTKVSPLVQASRMAEAGKTVTVVVVWFQFIAAPILTAVLLGGAMATEIHQRTLDVLFTTPIGNIQIVTGKLFSGLLQVGSLLAISLPPLAIVRVFGGVPWGFLVCGLCLTLATAVFMAALSLFLGVTNRQAHQVTMNALAFCVLFWFCSALVVALLTRFGRLSNATGTAILNLTNAFFILGMQTQGMVRGSGSGTPSLLWLLHCLIVLAGAGGLLLLSIWRLRKMAARGGEASVSAGQVVEEPALSLSKGRTTHRRLPWRRSQAIRPVKGSPIVWKELHRPRIARNRRGIWSAIFLGIIVCAVIACLVVMAVFDPKTLPSACVGLAFVAVGILGIDVAVSAAGAIPREREARTLPVLLTTALDDSDIVRGKAIGAVRRSLPLLAVPPVLIAVALLFSHEERSPVGPALILTGIALAYLVGAVTFVVGLGLHVGTRAKTVTAAVVVTAGLYIVARIVIGPCLLMMTVALTSASGSSDLAGVGLILGQVFSASVYVLIGLALISSAAGQLRRNVFI